LAFGRSLVKTAIGLRFFFSFGSRGAGFGVVFALFKLFLGYVRW